MPDIKSLQEEIKSLRKEVSEIWKKLASLEKGTVVKSQIETRQTKQEKPTSIGGIVLIVVGSLLSLTILGAIIGLPLLIWGIILTTKVSQKQTLPQQKVTKPQKPIKQIETTAILESKKRESSASFEEAIGIKWFSWIGILALVIGVGFFIKYAIDMNWVNHLTRIIMGVTFGVALIVFGEVISKKEQYLKWAQTLIGGGFAITYFSVYAAYHFLEYRVATGMSLTIDSILLSVVVVCAILFALKDNSQIIASESFFLGYITALLSNNFQLMTSIYFLLLTIGLVMVVSYKKWSVIGLGGVLASYGMYLFWNIDNPYSFASASFILISLFSAFTIQSLFLMKKKDVLGQNIAITLINSILFFVLYYFQIYKYYPDYAGLFTLGLAVFCLIGYYVFQYLKEGKFSTTYLYLTLLYITLAIPIQFNKDLIAIIWALETLILTATFLKLKINTFKIASYAVGALTIFKTFFYDTFFLDKLDLANLINSTRLFSFAAAIVCFYLIYIMLKKNKEILSGEERAVPFIYSWVAFVFLVFVVFLELIESHSVWVSVALSVFALIYIIISKVDIKEIRYQSFALSAILFFKVLFFDTWDLSKFNANDIFLSTRFWSFLVSILTFYAIAWYLENKKDKLKGGSHVLIDIYSYAGTILTFTLIMAEMEEFWISIGWAVLALIVMVIGFAAKKKQFRIQGMLILAIVIFKVFIYDTRNLDTIYRTLSYIVLGTILLLISFIYTKYKEKLRELL
jgi:uncharacterized membrane protein